MKPGNDPEWPYFGDESWLTKRHSVCSCIFTYVHVFSCIFIYFQNYLGDLGDLGLRLLADPLKNNNKKKHKDHGNLPAMQAAQSMIISIDSIAASSPRISRPQPVSGACESNQAEKGVQPQECDRLIDWTVWYWKITYQKRLVWCLVWLLFDKKNGGSIDQLGVPKKCIWKRMLGWQVWVSSPHSSAGARPLMSPGSDFARGAVCLNGGWGKHPCLVGIAVEQLLVWLKIMFSKTKGRICF